MPSVEDLRLDIEELQQLMVSATRQRVKDLLSLQLRKLQTELTTLQEKAAAATPDASKPLNKPKGRYTKDITNYGWDQSDNFMKIYVSDLKGIQNLNKDQVTLECTEKGFKFFVSNLDGKDYSLHIAHLYSKINPADSKHKVKTDQVVIMLKKQDTGKTWAYVTEQEKKTKEKKTPKMDEGGDPQDSLMNMMKQMYDEGDDEMKRTISKAWYESRNKNPMEGI